MSRTLAGFGGHAARREHGDGAAKHGGRGVGSPPDRIQQAC